MADVWTATPTADNAATYTLTRNGKDVTYTASGAATVLEITAGLTAAWNASTEPEHAEYTATDDTTHVTLTAVTAGAPATITGAATGAGALVLANTEVGSGPTSWDVAENWSGGAVPVNGDDVYVDTPNTPDILYGLDQTGVALATLTVGSAYTGRIGLPVRNEAGYTEDRDTYLTIAPTVLSVGAGTGDTTGAGPGRVKIDSGATQFTATVHGTGPPADAGVEALLLKGTNVANQLSVLGGSVGVAVLAGETSALASLRVAGGRVRTGPGTPVSSVFTSGGQTEVNGNIGTAANMTGGELTHRGAGTATAVQVDGGTFRYESTGAYGTIDVSDGGTVDATGDPRAKQVQTLTLHARAVYRDPHRTVNYGTSVVLYRCGFKDVDIDLGTHVELTVTAGP